MNRRGFLRLIGLGAAATVAQRVWPFRTFSFAPAKRLFIPDMARCDLINIKTWGKVQWGVAPFWFQSREFYRGDQYLAWDEKRELFVSGKDCQA